MNDRKTMAIPSADEITQNDMNVVICNYTLRDEYNFIAKWLKKLRDGCMECSAT